MDEKLQAVIWKGDFDNYWLGHQFAEIFKDRIYAPYLENKPNAVVLDIGACIGIFTLYASKYAKMVYAIEPAVDHFDSLTRMLTFNQIKNVKPIRKAIFIDNKQFPFFHNKNRTMYSLHQAIEDNSQKVETVEAVTLDKLFEDEKIEHIDLLKADVEGSEYELFAGEGFSKVASKIDTVICEVHQWAGRHRNQINESFKNNGFDIQPIAGDADLMVATRRK